MDERVVSRVGELVATDAGVFADRVAEEAEALKGELELGTFDNPRALVGFEYEFYGVDSGTGVLRRVPGRLLDLLGTSRTALLVEGLERRLSEIVSEESFRRRVREAYYDGEIDGETLAALLGREEAHRVELLRESLARESRLPTAAEIEVRGTESFYDGPVPTHPVDEADDGEDSAAGSEPTGDATDDG